MGQKVVVVRCEEIEITGSLIRNRLKFMAFLRKKMNTNPTRGGWHFRAPSRIFYRAIRGMTPHKSPRGERALERLKVFEGVPPAYVNKKKVVVPNALRVIRLRPDRVTTRLGDLSKQVGWKYNDVVKTLEEKRKAKVCFSSNSTKKKKEKKK